MTPLPVDQGKCERALKALFNELRIVDGEQTRLSTLEAEVVIVAFLGYLTSAFDPEKVTALAASIARNTIAANKLLAVERLRRDLDTWQIGCNPGCNSD